MFTVDVATGALSLVATNGTIPGRGSINSESRVSFAPDGRRLALAAYGSGPDSSSQVVAVNLDGSDALRLTDIPQGAGDPSWSPDGQRVAYYANGAIATVRTDGTDDRRLVAGNGSPDWGPPGPPLTPGGPCSVERLGTAGSDTLEGTDAADDDLSGLGGNDVLRGLAGDDCLRGGSGNDALSGGAGEDRLLGQAGKDQLSGGEGDDRLAGGAGIDDLEGGDDRDQLAGGSGKDALKGGAGNDSLIGGGGVNTYAAGAGNDRVSARNGEAEVVNCGPGRDRARTDPADVRISCERQLGRGR